MIADVFQMAFGYCLLVFENKSVVDPEVFAGLQALLVQEDAAVVGATVGLLAFVAPVGAVD
jgi:hypothetical protein